MVKKNHREREFNITCSLSAVSVKLNEKSQCFAECVCVIFERCMVDGWMVGWRAKCFVWKFL